MSNHSRNALSYSRDQLCQLAEDVLAHARRIGASGCETDVSEGFGLSVTVRKGEVETIEYNRDKGIGVTVHMGQRRGNASTSDFSPAALRATVEKAATIASFTAEDPCGNLPEPEQLAGNSGPELDLFHPWDLPVEAAVAVAQRSEQAALAVSPLITNTEGASVSAQQSHFISANSLGFMAGYATTRHYIACTPIAGSDDDMQRDDWYSSHRDPADLAAPEVIGDYAARRTLARLGARKLKTRHVPVLFEAPLAAGLIGSFTHAVSGGALYRKTTFLLDSLGTQVFPDFVNIIEDPLVPKGQASGWFDDEGVATRRREVVKNGVLQGYFLSNYSARKLGMQTTGNAGGCHNLIVQPGRHNFASLVKTMGRGLLVTELLGHGVNYVNGDYSRGAAGYWVDNGVIQYAVEEVTIAGNLRDMFRGIVAIGNDVVVRGSKQVGSILIDRMTVAGN